jgi:beta-galactosidase
MSEKILKIDHLMMGADYYPEHWDESLWKSDLERMEQAGIERIRIAEFAWSKFEPLDGNFTFAFFDHFFEFVEKTDIRVIFGTPSATPPAWLTTKYPEVLNSRIDGVKYRHGGRRHYTYNSPVYNQYVQRIVDQLGAHYGKNKCIAGWQIDNEINCEENEFYSDSDTIAFREFLKRKYHTLDALNDAWGTVFWNQTYTDWDEVFVPQVVLNDSMNPHRRLDFIRFISDSARNFVKMQSDILRRYIKPGDFITTNGLFGHLDNHAMTGESLDFLTYDSYPDFAYMSGNSKDEDNLRDRMWTSFLTEVRSVSPVFGIMEQQSGAGGWTSRMKMPEPRPGQIQLWSFQSIANGADYIGYFRWRTSPVSTEIYWHGILDYSGRDNRRLAEVQDMKRRMAALSELAGSRFEAAFAVLKDYDNKWDDEIDIWLNEIDTCSQKGLFAASEHTHTPLDYVYLTDTLTLSGLIKYKVIFYPHPAILSEETVGLLEQYVLQGGTLVFGCRTGLKDSSGRCVQENLPGTAQKLTGADVIDFTVTAPDDEKALVAWEDTDVDALCFTDILQTFSSDTEISGTYKNNYYTGKGALTCRKIGKGHCYYYGSTFSEQAATVFLKKSGVADPYTDLFSLPEDIELLVRQNKNSRWFFILNYTKREQSFTVKQELKDAESGLTVQGIQHLNPYQVVVLRQYRA